MTSKSAIATLLFVLAPCLLQAQTVTSFEGIDATEVSQPSYEVDATGAVGTKQYMQWTNSYYQAFSKTSPYTAVWASPEAGDTPWENAGLSNCYGAGGGEATVTFDRLASRWVIAKRAGPSTNVYYYCIAVSSTDDLTSPTLTWYTYQFDITPNLGVNSTGNVYYPDYPKLGTWLDGYYASFDLEDPNNQYQEIGVVACVFDRTNIIINAPARAQQCFSNPSPIPNNGALYLAHSLMPADIDGTTAPPSGRHEYLVSIQNPPADGKTLTSTKLNIFNFHVNWTTPTKSTFTKSQITVPSYEPGCYNVADPVNTFCVNEPSSKSTGNFVDSIGDRLTPRLAFRNFTTYESFLVSHTVQVGTGTNQQTGIRWYELRGSTTVPALYQDGTVSNGTTLYRFVPSIAQDNVGNAAVGYSVSSNSVHPGIRAATFSLPNKTTPTELTIQNGVGDDENSEHWTNLTSMTVDPTDNCTFWYTNQYYKANETGSNIDWNTRIAYFKLSSCH
jgi:hypothetical protein